MKIKIIRCHGLIFPFRYWVEINEGTRFMGELAITYWGAKRLANRFMNNLRKEDMVLMEIIT